METVEKINQAIGVLAKHANKRELKALHVVTTTLKEVGADRDELLAMLKELSSYSGGDETATRSKHPADRARVLLRRYE